MADKAERDYNILIRYVEQKILDGAYSLGDRLPPAPERKSPEGRTRKDSGKSPEYSEYKES